MIIFIGSLPGSGAEVLAKKLADNLQYLYYPVRLKLARYIRALSGPGRVKDITVSDDFRLRVFKQIADDLPLLAKVHNGLVITGSFQRVKMRNVLFNAARGIADVLFVWVESPDDLIIQHEVLRGKNAAFPETVALRKRVRQRIKNEFEPFTTPPLIFENTGAEDSAQRFCTMVLAEMKRIEGKS